MVIDRMLSHNLGSESGQVDGFGVRAPTPFAACCPIEVENLAQVDHPLLGEYFDRFDGNRYHTAIRAH